MILMVDRQGDVRCLYSEALDLASLGTMSIQRASHVEPDATGNWRADLSPMQGPTLGPYPRRSDALSAEEDWLVKRLAGASQQNDS